MKTAMQKFTVILFLTKAGLSSEEFDRVANEVL